MKPNLEIPKDRAPGRPEKAPAAKGPDALSRRDFLALSAQASATMAMLASGCRARGLRILPPGPLGSTSDSALAPFGLTGSRAGRVMAKAMSRGGDFCDLFFQRRKYCYLGLEDSSVNRAQTLVDRGVGIRVVKGSQTGFAYTESLDEKSMLQAAEVASAVASGGARKAPKAYKISPTGNYYLTDPLWERVGAKEKVNLMMGLDRKIRAKDSRIKKVMVSFRDEESHVVVLDSEGRIVHDRQPMTTCYALCVGEQKGRRESNYCALSGREGMAFYSPERLARMVDEAVKRTVVLFDSVPGPVGELPVVMAPGSSGILLHEAIGHGMEADFARKKTTIYTGKVGQRIAPEHVTIVDDGTNRNLRGSINIDDEANASKRTVLVEKGILRTFMHDRISAAHFKVTPTGNGRRQSFRHIPMPRMRNTYMLAGPHDPKEIIRSVKRGIYAVSFANGQVFIGAGDFTFYIKTGYLIENGKLTAPIKDINIIGNGPKALKKVEMVGSDLKLDEGGWTCGKSGQRVPVGLGLPTLKVSGITVGGTARKRGGARRADRSGPIPEEQLSLGTLNEEVLA